jgi:hypothetical protein
MKKAYVLVVVAALVVLLTSGISLGGDTVEYKNGWEIITPLVQTAMITPEGMVADTKSSDDPQSFGARVKDLLPGQCWEFDRHWVCKIPPGMTFSQLCVDFYGAGGMKKVKKVWPESSVMRKAYNPDEIYAEEVIILLKINATSK